ncbi:large ribosomal subunit protein uL10m isoform X2 [Pogoniulus pusillus]|uniref:large ribosomal subunit protein uL10m isoform X2 n=1 Tax=Pogoniulus pusillus TaxID=488313 RepID=UPI0030B9A929
MAALSGGCSPWLRRARLPSLQLVRHGSKAVTRHWKAMHFQRQKLMAVTEYIAPRPAVPPRCLPPRDQTVEKEDGYRRLLQRQVQEVFQANRMVAVCQFNSMPDEEVVLMRHYLRKHNIEVKFVLNEIVRPVLSQSKYKNLLPLFVARNILLVSPETKAKEMLRVLRGVPQVNLLGACIDDTILSRQGVENFAKLPSLEATQGQTVGALSLLPSQTCSLLQSGPAHLTALLDQHLRRLRDEGMGGPAGATESTAGATGSPSGATESTAGATESTAGATGSPSGATESTAGATESTAGATGSPSGATESTAGATGSPSGATESTAGATGSPSGATESTAGATESTAGATGSPSGATESTAGATGSVAGSTGSLAGATGSKGKGPESPAGGTGSKGKGPESPAGGTGSKGKGPESPAKPNPAQTSGAH